MPFFLNGKEWRDEMKAHLKSGSDVEISSVQSLSHVRLSATPRIAAHQTSLSITNSQSSLRLTFIESVMPSSHLILCRPLLLPPSIFLALGSYLKSQFFASGAQSTGISASVLPMNIQDWFPLGWTAWISLQEDPQESFPIPQFKSIGTSVLSFSPTLTSKHDYWKSHSFN